MKKGERFLREEPDKYLAIHSGYILRGYSLTPIDNQWRMIVKIKDARGNKLVGFIVMATITDCWEYLYLHLTTVSAPLRWSMDRYG